MFKKIQVLWGKLPKTVKVFCFLAVSYTLKAVAVELGAFEDSFFADYLVGIINIALVFFPEAVPEARKLLKR